MDRLREEVEKTGQHRGAKNSLNLGPDLYHRPACPANMEHHNQVIDAAIPSDTNIKTKEHEKLEKKRGARENVRSSEGQSGTSSNRRTQGFNT